MIRRCRIELSSELVVTKEDFGFVFTVWGRSIVLKEDEARYLCDCLKHGKDCYLPLGWTIVKLDETGLELGRMKVKQDTVTYEEIIDEIERGLSHV